jgi:GT2 family glycosyltransferase
MMVNNTNPKVSVIILNWNGWKDTIECLESLYQNNYPNYDVVLVDNDSNDDSIEKITKYCSGQLDPVGKYSKHITADKPIKINEYREDEVVNLKPNHESPVKVDSNRVLNLIRNQSNHGFAEGNNVGIRYALKVHNPDYLLLLNNDTVVHPDFMLEMVKTADEHGDVGFVGSKTYLYHEENILQAAGGGNVDFKHGVVHEIASNREDNGEFDDYMEMDYVGGACLMCKREVVEQIGVLDSRFFMYWEDVNWCLTGREHGYRSAYAYKSKIWHKYGASSQSHFKIYYLNRNRIYVIKEHAVRNEYLYFLFYFFLYRLWIEGFDYLLKQGNSGKFKCLFKGAIDGLRGP